MADTFDFIIEKPDASHRISITPINITVEDGMLYHTGQYDLAEGTVGIGTITFTDSDDWTFDGVTEYSEDDIHHIAEFIRSKDRQPGGFVDGQENP